MPARSGSSKALTLGGALAAQQREMVQLRTQLSGLRQELLTAVQSNTYNLAAAAKPAGPEQTIIQVRHQCKGTVRIAHG